MDAGPPDAPAMCDGGCGGVADDCNDGVCTGGTCAKAPKPDGTACDAGLFCSVNDACWGGYCMPGTPKPCDTGNPCTLGSCNEQMQACDSVPADDGTPCQSSDPCVAGSTCMAGECKNGHPADCSTLDGACTTGVCIAFQGCTKMPANDGQPCTTVMFCEVNQTCMGGACIGAPRPCAQPTGDECQIGTCVEAAASCEIVPAPDGTACTPPACKVGTTCTNGACGGGAPGPNGGVCDDSNACTANDVCTGGVCAGTPITACVNGDGCCPPGCLAINDNDCKLLKVAVEGNPGACPTCSFYSDATRAWLAAQPGISSATEIEACDLATLSQYDVLLLWDPMKCFDENAFDAYVQGGGGLIGTPLLINNNVPTLAALPVDGIMGNPDIVPLDVTVLDPADPLLQGVAFAMGDMVHFEDWVLGLRPGATAAAQWNSLNTTSNPYAVAKWTYGAGRAVYLDFDYVMAGPWPDAIKYGWGQTLLYNAVLWAAKQK
jgi:hypothetical protein